MNNRLYVVHHSKPLDAPALHPSLLPLSREGIMLASPVVEASFWSSVRTIYYSPEMQAAQTAELIANRWSLELQLADDLSDMWLVNASLPQAELEQIIGEHLQGTVEHPLLEPYDEAQRRIVNCVQRLARQHAGDNFAIVSHARILTALYSHILGRRLGRQEWLSIRTPDLSVIDTSAWQVTDGFLSELT